MKYFEIKVDSFTLLSGFLEKGEEISPLCVGEDKIKVLYVLTAKTRVLAEPPNFWWLLVNFYKNFED